MRVLVDGDGARARLREVFPAPGDYQVNLFARPLPPQPPAPQRRRHPAVAQPEARPDFIATLAFHATAGDPTSPLPFAYRTWHTDYTLESAEQAVAAGDADLIAFGRPFISNPDLVARFRHGWPLARPADMATWYAPTGAKGYTDFPPHAPG